MKFSEKIFHFFKGLLSINMGMSPFSFFKKAFRKSGFSLAEITSGHYSFIKNKVSSGKVVLKTREGDIKFDDVFFLITQKIQVMERFCTLSLTYKVEIVNDDLMNIFSKKFKENIYTILVFSDVREFSFKMENESDIYDYGIETFKDIVEKRFEEMIRQFKTSMLNKQIFFKTEQKNGENEKFEAVVNLDDI